METQLAFVKGENFNATIPIKPANIMGDILKTWNPAYMNNLDKGEKLHCEFYCRRNVKGNYNCVV